MSHEESLAVQKYYDEPATLPRLTQCVIYTKLAPWVCVVRASMHDRGVTVGDCCESLKAWCGALPIPLPYLLLGLWPGHIGYWG
jgi:hypothetical protein